MTLPSNGLCEYRATVGHDWLDYNQHMNVASYLKAFDDGGEALRGDELRIESRVVDFDEKEIQLCQEMSRGPALLATHEQLGRHFDTVARRKPGA